MRHSLCGTRGSRLKIQVAKKGLGEGEERRGGGPHINEWAPILHQGMQCGDAPHLCPMYTCGNDACIDRLSLAATVGYDPAMARQILIHSPPSLAL